MAANRTGFKNIDEYIAGFPREVQGRLQQIRRTISETAPDAEETISYQIPTFKWNGYLVYFAAYKNHIALYPVPAGNAKFNKALSAYRTGKGTVRFPLDKPIPFDLVVQIVKLRMEDNLKKAKSKAKKS